jgi:hypothetical protein
VEDRLKRNLVGAVPADGRSCWRAPCAGFRCHTYARHSLIWAVPTPATNADYSVPGN